MTRDQVEILRQKSCIIGDLIVVVCCSLIVMAMQTHNVYEIVVNPAKPLYIVQLAIFLGVVFDLLVTAGCSRYIWNTVKRLRSL